MLGLESNTITCDVFLIQIKDRIRMIKRHHENFSIDDDTYIRKIDRIMITIDELYLSGIIDDVLRD